MGSMTADEKIATASALVVVAFFFATFFPVIDALQDKSVPETENRESGVIPLAE